MKHFILIAVLLCTMSMLSAFVSIPLDSASAIQLEQEIAGNTDHGQNTEFSVTGQTGLDFYQLRLSATRKLHLELRGQSDFLPLVRIYPTLTMEQGFHSGLYLHRFEGNPDINQTFTLGEGSYLFMIEGVEENGAYDFILESSTQDNERWTVATNPQPANEAANVSLNLSDHGGELSWTPGTGTHFDLYFGTRIPLEDPTYNQLELVDQDATTITSWAPPLPLEEGTIYFWKIVMKDSAGDPTALPALFPTWAFTTEAPPVQNLAVTKEDYVHARITWDAPSDTRAFLGYTIFRDANEGNGFVQISPAPPNYVQDTEFLDDGYLMSGAPHNFSGPGLKPATYTYKVIAEYTQAPSFPNATVDVEIKGFNTIHGVITNAENSDFVGGVIVSATRTTYGDPNEFITNDTTSNPYFGDNTNSVSADGSYLLIVEADDQYQVYADGTPVQFDPDSTVVSVNTPVDINDPFDPTDAGSTTADFALLPFDQQIVVAYHADAYPDPVPETHPSTINFWASDGSGDPADEPVDPDGNTLTYTWTVYETDDTYNTGSALNTWSDLSPDNTFTFDVEYIDNPPTVFATGYYVIELFIDDNYTPGQGRQTSSHTWNVHVQDINQDIIVNEVTPPENTTADPLEIAETESLTFFVDAEDPDEQGEEGSNYGLFWDWSVTEMDAAWNPGLTHTSVDSDETYDFLTDFTPDAPTRFASGNYRVRLDLSDVFPSGTPDSEQFNWYVTVSDSILVSATYPPVGTSRTIAEGDTLHFSLSATDPDQPSVSPTFTWTVTDDDSTIEYPITPAAGQPADPDFTSRMIFTSDYLLDGASELFDAGSYTVRLQVEDHLRNRLSVDTYEWTVTVTDVDQDISVTSVTPAEGDLGEYQENFPAATQQTFTFVGHDPDTDTSGGNDLDFQWTATSGTLSWTSDIETVSGNGDNDITWDFDFITAAQTDTTGVNPVFGNGSWTIEMTVSDSYGRDQLSYQWTIDIYDSWSISAPTPASPVNMTEEDSVTLSVNVTDNDGGPMNYSWEISTDGVQFETIQGASGSSYDFNGAYLPADGYSAGQYWVRTYAFNLPSTWDPYNMTIPPSDMPPYQWQIDVSNVNRPPVIDSYLPDPPTATIDEFQSQTFSVSASEPDGETITYTWQVYETDSGFTAPGDPGDWNTVGANADTYTLLTDYLEHDNFFDAGYYLVRLIADDGVVTRASVEQQWQLTVNNVDRPFDVTVSPVGSDITLDEGESQLFQVISAIDPDQEQLEITWAVAMQATPDTYLQTVQQGPMPSPASGDFDFVTDQTNSSFPPYLWPAGEYHVTATVANPVTREEVDTVWNVTVQDVLDNPTFYPAAEQTIYEPSATPDNVELGFNGSDPDTGDTLVYTWQIQNSDGDSVGTASVNPYTFTASALPGAGQYDASGSPYTVTLSVEDDNPTPSVQYQNSWTITVVDTDQSIVITATTPADVSVSRTEAQGDLAFSIDAYDPDGNDLDHTWSLYETDAAFTPPPVPSGWTTVASDVDNWLMPIDYTDNDGSYDAGYYLIMVQMQDNYGTRSTRTHMWMLSVTETNQQLTDLVFTPPLTPAITIAEPDNQNLSVTATDPDGIGFTWSWYVWDQNDVEPSIPQSSGTVTGITGSAEFLFDSHYESSISPLRFEAGSYWAKVVLQDQIGSQIDTYDYTWEIIVTNTIPPIAITEVSPLENPVIRDEESDNVLFEVYGFDPADPGDPQGDNLTYDWSATDGRLTETWTDYGKEFIAAFGYENDLNHAGGPIFGSGTWTITVEVSNANTSATQDWSMNVTNIDRPIVAVETPSDDNPVAINEGQSVDFSVAAYDPDYNDAFDPGDDPLTYTWTLDSGNGYQPVTPGPEDYEYTFTADYVSAGTHFVNLTIFNPTDGPTSSVSRNWEIVVQDVNNFTINDVQPPTSGTVELNEGDAQTFLVDLTHDLGHDIAYLWTIVRTDENGNPIGNVSNVSTSANWNMLTDFHTHDQYRSAGWYAVSLNASTVPVDNDDTIDFDWTVHVSQTLTGSVTPPADADVHIDQGSSQTFEFVNVPSANPTLTYTWDMDSGNGYQTLGNTGNTYLLDVPADRLPPYDLRLTVSAPGASNTLVYDWHVVVDDVDWPTQVTCLPNNGGNLTVFEGETINFQAFANDPDTPTPYYDWRVDGNQVSTASVFNFQAEGYDGTPAGYDLGDYAVTLEVGDGQGRSVFNTSWNVTVEHQNVPLIAVVTPPAGQISLIEGQSQLFTVVAQDPDGPAPLKDWQLDGSQVSTGNTFNYVTADGSAGPHTLVLTVTEDMVGGSSLVYTWSITVTEGGILVNDFQPAQTELSIYEFEAVNFLVDAVDQSGGTLSYTWTLDGANVGGDQNTYDFLTDGTFAQVDPYVIACNIQSDGPLGDSVDLSWNVTVNESNIVIDDIQPTPGGFLEINESETINFSVQAHHSGGLDLYYDWLLDGSSVSTTTTYDFVTDYDSSDQSPYTVQLEVTDNQTAPVGYTWEVTVLDGNIVVTLVSPPEGPLPPIRETQTASFEVQAETYQGGPVNKVWRVNGADVATGSTYTFVTDYDETGGLFDAGLYLITCHLDDGQGNTDVLTWSQVVTDVDRDIVLNDYNPALGTQNIIEGQGLPFWVDATDPDGNQLSYSWTRQHLGVDPQPVQVSTSSSYYFTSTYTSSGQWIVAVEISDGWGSRNTVNLSWTVDVADYDPAIVVTDIQPDPALPIVMDEGETVEFLITAYDTIGRPIQYNWQLDDGEQQTTVSTTNTYNFTPDYLMAGTYTMTLDAATVDGRSSVQYQWNITVNNAQAPIQVVELVPDPGAYDIDEGETLQFYINAIEPNGLDLYYSWQVSTNGQPLVEVDTDSAFDFVTTGSLNRNYTAGIYTVTLDVTNEGGSRETLHYEWTVTVHDTDNNDSPIVVNSLVPAEGHIVMTEGDIQQFVIDAYDPDGNSLSYTWDITFENQAPETVSRQDNWTFLTDNTSAGDYVLDLTVTDNFGLRNTLHFHWTIEVQDDGTCNQPITVVSLIPDPGDVELTEGDSQLFSIDAFDPCGNVLVYDWELQFAGQDWHNVSTSADYNMVTDNTWAGSYRLRLTVDNNNPLTRETLVYTWQVLVHDDDDDGDQLIVVNSIQPQPWNQVIDEGETLNFMIDAYDPDGNQLEYTWELDRNGQGPEIVSRLDSWDMVTDNTWAGSYTLDLTVTDNFGLRDVRTFQWTITVNDVPDGEDNPIVVNSLVPAEGLVILDEGESQNFRINAYDPDGNPLEYNWNLQYEGQGWEQVSRTSEYDFVTNYTSAGMYELRLEVTDNYGGRDSRTFGWQIQVNDVDNQDQPIVVQTLVPAPGDITIHETENIDFLFEGYDPDGNRLVYTWTLREGQEESVVSRRNFWTFTTDFTSAGVYQVELTVSDNFGNRNTLTYNWQILVLEAEQNILVTNLVPDPGSYRILEGEQLAFLVEAIHQNNDPIYYDWALDDLSTPDGYQTVSTTNNWTLDSNVWSVGSYRVRLTLTDYQISELQYNWDVTVLDANAPFVILDIQPSMGGNLTMFETETQDFSVDAYDPDGDDLYYSWKLNGLEVSSTNAYSFATNYNSAGSYVVSLEVSDNSGQRDAMNFTWDVTVRDVDRPIVVNSVIPSEGGLQTMLEGETMAFAFDGYDPDGNDLTYRWRMDGRLVSTTSDYLFQTNSDSAGNYELTLLVTDSFGTRNTLEYLWDIQVLNYGITVNSLIPEPGVVNTQINQTVAFSVNASGLNPLSYSWKKNGTEESTDTSYDFLSAVAGDFVVTLNITDPVTEEDLQFMWDVRVIDPANPDQNIVVLAINPAPGEVIINENQNIPFSINAYDPDGNPLEYSWTLDGVVVSETSTYNFTTDASSAGFYEVRLVVSDGYGSRHVLRYDWAVTVLEIDQPIVLVDIQPSPGGEITIYETDTVHFAIDAYDPDGNPLEYSWTLDGTVMSTSPNWDYVTDYNSAGIHEVRLDVNDGHVDRNGMQFIWRVEVVDVDQPIVVNNLQPAEGYIGIIEEETVNFLFDGYDPDGSDLTYSWKKDGTEVATTATWDMTTAVGDAGRYDITLDVSDGNTGRNQLSYYWRVQVASLLQPIIVTGLTPPPGAVEIYEGETLAFDVDAYAQDGGQLWYQWTLDGATVSETDVWNMITDYDWAGTYQVGLSVADNPASRNAISFDWDITVLDVDQAIVVNSLVPSEGIHTITEGETLSFAIDAYDPDGNALEYEWMLDGNQVSTNDAWDYVTDNQSAGTHAVGLTVTDNYTRSMLEYGWTVNVLDNGGIDTPIVVNSILPAPGNVSVREGLSLSFSIDAYDPDGNALEYEWMLDGSQVSTTMQYDYQPGYTDAGDHTMDLTVTDNFGTRNTIQYHWDIDVIDFDQNGDQQIVINNVYPDPGTITGNEYETIPFRIDAVDPDGNEVDITWRLNGTIIGQGPTHFLPLTTAMIATSPHAVTASLTDNYSGRNSLQLSWSLTVLDVPVIVTNLQPAPGAITINENQSQPFTISASAPNALSYSWTLNGVEQSTSNAWTFSTNYNSAGLYAVQLTVTEEGNDEPTLTFDWQVTVNNVDRPVVVNQILPSAGGDWMMFEGDREVFSIDAYDPDGNQLTYLWLLDGIQVSSESSWIFEPGYEDAGRYQVRLMVTDGTSERDSQSWQWDVNVNDVDQPIVVEHILPGPGGLLNIQEFEAVHFLIDAYDPDGNELQYSWILDGIEMSATNTWDFTTNGSSARPNPYVVDLMVTDNTRNSLHYTWTITVTESGISVSSIQPSPGGTVNMLETETINFLINANSPSPLEYEWKLDGETVSLINTYDFTTDYDSEGSYTVTLHVQETQGDGSLDYTWSVNVADNDRTIVVDSLTPTTGGDLTIFETQTQVFAIDAYDPDGNPLQYNWVLDGQTVSTTASYSFVTDLTMAGHYTLSLDVTDGQGSRNSLSWTWNITVRDWDNIDSPIVVNSIVPAPGSITMAEGQSQSFLFDGYDPDGNELEYTWTFDGEVVGNEAGYTYDADYESAGNHNLHLQVTDNFGNRNTLNYSWTITVNDAAIVVTSLQPEPGAYTIAENQSIAFSVVASAPQTITYDWSLNGATVSSTPDYLFTTDTDSAGDYDVVLTLSTPQRETATFSWDVTVTDVDQAIVVRRVIPAEENPVIFEGETQTFAFDGYDPDGNDLNYSWKLNSAEVSTVATYTYVSNYESAGTYEVTLEVDDGNQRNALSYGWTLTVDDVDRPIVVNQILPNAGGFLEMNENESQGFSIEAYDPDGNDLEYDWRLDGRTMSTIESYIYSPTFADAGEHLLQLEVTDNWGERNTLTYQWYITVHEVDLPIVVNSIIPDPDSNIRIRETESVDFLFDGYDPDGNPLSYQWSVNGFVVGDQSGYTFETDFNSAGAYVVRLRVSDGSGTRNTLIYNWNVTVVDTPFQDHAIIVESLQPEPGALNIDETESIHFSIEAFDPDGNALTYSWRYDDGSGFTEVSTDPAWSFLTDNTYGRPDPYYVRLIVSDEGDIERNVQTFNWTVTVNNIDIIVNSIQPTPGPLTVTAGETIDFAIDATNPLGNIFYRYTLDGTPVAGVDSWSWTTTVDDIGSHDVILQVTDYLPTRLTTLSYRWMVTVVPPDAQIVVNSINPAPGNYVIPEASSMQFVIDAEDSEGNDLNYSWLLNEGEGYVEVATRNTWSFDTDFNSAGDYDVRLLVDNSPAGDDQLQFDWVVVVDDVNRPIVVDNLQPATGQLLEIHELESQSFWIDAYDPDGHDLAYEWRLESPDHGIDMIVSTTSQYTMTTDYNSAGRYYVTLTVSESGTLQTPNQQTFEWTMNVLDRDRAIVVLQINPIPGTNIILYEGQRQQFDFSGYDPDGNDLTYSWLLDGLEVGTESGYNYLTDYNSAGFHLLSLTVSDGTGRRNELFYTWSIQVYNVNRPPFLSQEIPDRTVEEDNFMFIIDLNDYFIDPDGDVMSFTPTYEDREISITMNGRFAIFQPVEHWYGTTEVSFLADDGQDDQTRTSRRGTAESNTFQIIVTPVNDAPILVEPFVDFGFLMNTVYTGLNLNDHFWDPDLPQGTDLVFSDGNPALHPNLTVDIASDGSVTITPAQDYVTGSNPDEQILFTAMDDQFATTQDQVDVTVYEAFWYNSAAIGDGWNLISVPGQVVGSDHPADVLGDDITPFYTNPYFSSIFGYEPQDFQYHVPSEIERGKGYWVNVNPDNTILDAYGYIDEHPFTVETPANAQNQITWHLVGNPFDETIQYGDQIMDGLDAVGWWWDPSIFGYRPFRFAPPQYAVLPPWAGMFVSTGNVDASFTFVSPTTREFDTEEQSSPDDWEIRIAATNGDYNANFMAGASAYASDGFDGRDVPTMPELPFLPQFQRFNLYADNDGWTENPGPYMRDIRGLNPESWQWELELTSGVDIEINLADAGSLAPDYRVILTNPRTGETVDLRHGSMFCSTNAMVRPEQNQHDTIPSDRMRLILTVTRGATETTGDAVPPVEELWTNNYPNPFNPETTIRFALPEAGRTTIGIYNVRGQLIRTLVDQSLEQGLHEVIWQGQDENGKPVASGVYFYRLDFGDQTITRRMMMLK